jgi:hypothetical protein
MYPKICLICIIQFILHIIPINKFPLQKENGGEKKADYLVDC